MNICDRAELYLISSDFYYFGGNVCQRCEMWQLAALGGPERDNAKEPTLRGKSN